MPNATCKYCKREMRPGVACTVKFYDDLGDSKKWKRQTHDGDTNCHDCNAPPGGLHHPGCDMERCPKCGGQAIGCDCVEEDTEHA